ncbi:cip1-interacting zinc finger protein [Pelodytes ibericus]
MFNQQQQFHQLMQLQHLLQQQQQQQQHPVQHQHPAPRTMQPSVQHQQPQQMLNLTTANPARLLNAHPMLQRALLMQQMQGNLRGLSMGAPPMPHFFPAAARQSILGTPPLGMTMKGPSMAFPSLPFQQQHRMYQKDRYRSYDRKREGEQASTFQARDNDKHSAREETELPPAVSEADENVSSSEDSENLTDCSIIGPLEPSAKKARSSLTSAEEAAFSAEGEGEMKTERCVESQTTESVSGGRALKVTIQQRSQSRTISTTMLKPKCTGQGGSSTQAGPRFCCYICKSNFHSLQAFQSHLVTPRHHQKLQDIQHLSNACLVTLMPTAMDDNGTAIDGKKNKSRWCNVCQIHFSSDLIKHRRTREHKLAKRSLRPFCTVCSRHFKTPRKFVEHMKSPEHKQKSQEVRLGEKEPWSLEEPEELITVDAVGCFEEEDDDEEEEEEGISEDDPSGDTEGLQAPDEVTGLPEQEGWEKYSPDTAYGLDFIVPVAGYLCRLCHKFYSSDSAARLSHCKSLTHYQNVQRYKVLKSRSASQKESGPHAKSVETLEDDSAAPISREQCRVAEPKDGDLALQGMECAIPASLAYQDKNALTTEAEVISMAIGGPSTSADGLVDTSEEDAGSLLEKETLLESVGVSKLPEEKSATNSDSSCLTNSRSSHCTPDTV